MGQLYYTIESQWRNFIEHLLGEWSVYAPVRRDSGLSYEFLNKDNLSGIELNTHRAVQPLKTFSFFFYEQITNITKFQNLRGFVVMGLKACDLNSLQLYDKMFLEGEFVEPFYKRRRQDLLLIGCDCQEPLRTCFCAVLGAKPYPEEYFDINLSLIGSSLIVEVNSEKGEEFIKRKKEIFKKLLDRSILTKREVKRRAVFEKIQQSNADWDIKAPFLDIMRTKLNSQVWNRMSETCVICGGCTNICPTCYCFLITEKFNPKKENGGKLRYWDSCQYTGFARVAGGANPRKKIYQRLRHRYLHKFDYIRENFGFDGCTGCGRCIEVCQGKIDIRKVLSELKKDA